MSTPDSIAIVERAAGFVASGFTAGEATTTITFSEVGIIDLGVDVPDLRPEPRVPEELRRYIPQRIADLHDVLVGVVVGKRYRLANLLDDRRAVFGN